jgi:hypothetical protein
MLLEVKMKNKSVFIKYYSISTDVCQAENEKCEEVSGGEIMEKDGNRRIDWQ